jgi:bacillithiol system protein YtxJ
MLSSLFSKTPKIKWNHLSSDNHLVDLDEKSKERPVIIFKHSTRCSISAMALSRFERNYESESGFDPYFLDLIANRNLSNQIAKKYQIVHQSPQVIVIKNGKAIFDASHNAISFNEVREQANN